LVVVRSARPSRSSWPGARGGLRCDRVSTGGRAIVGEVYVPQSALDGAPAPVGIAGTPRVAATTPTPWQQGSDDLHGITGKDLSSSVALSLSPEEVQGPGKVGTKVVDLRRHATIHGPRSRDVRGAGPPRTPLWVLDAPQGASLLACVENTRACTPVITATSRPGHHHSARRRAGHGTVVREIRSGPRRSGPARSASPAGRASLGLHRTVAMPVPVRAATAPRPEQDRPPVGAATPGRHTARVRRERDAEHPAQLRRGEQHPGRVRHRGRRRGTGRGTALPRNAPAPRLYRTETLSEARASQQP
jgi:hypothetical protein